MQSPNHKVQPARAKDHLKHGDHQIQVASRLSLAIATQRNVKITKTARNR